MKSDLNYNIGFFQLFCNKKSLQHQNFLPTPAGSYFLIHLYSLAKIQRNPSSSRLQFTPSSIRAFTVLNLNNSKHSHTSISTCLSRISPAPFLIFRSEILTFTKNGQSALLIPLVAPSATSG